MAAPPAPQSVSRPAPPPPPPPAATPRPTEHRRDDDLADILAKLEDEPVSSPDTATALSTSDDSESAVLTEPAPRLGGSLTDPRDLERPSTASKIVIESDGGLDFDPSFASFAKRSVELLVDTVVLGLALLPGVVIAAVAGSVWFIGLIVALIGFLVYVTVAARSIAASGQWIGNRVAGTHIVDGIKGTNIDVGRAALRVIVRYLISTILLLGFLIAFADGQRRTFHDRLARTVVTGRAREVWTADRPNS